MILPPTHRYSATLGAMSTRTADQIAAFNDNPQLPVMRYGTLALTSDTGLNELFHVLKSGDSGNRFQRAPRVSTRPSGSRARAGLVSPTRALCLRSRWVCGSIPESPWSFPDNLYCKCAQGGSFGLTRAPETPGAGHSDQSQGPRRQANLAGVTARDRRLGEFCSVPRRRLRGSIRGAFAHPASPEAGPSARGMHRRYPQRQPARRNHPKITGGALRSQPTVVDPLPDCGI